ncbi:hypothetical protein KY290_026060 [Solanum tuberosum]|uniref:Uncharacterized protein n=1 Tax=Solanum tuberosum TaxID=4113 RepID=A0ABQ7UVB6_SOLTU|nr:hypothetical protein KY290_026060 [Solanum tuberosum]
MEAVRNKNYKEMDKNAQPKSQKEGDQKKEIRSKSSISKRINGKHKKRGTIINYRHLEAILDKQNRPPIRQESSRSLEVLDNYKGTKGDSRPHTAVTNQKGQDEYNRKIANARKDTTKQLQVDIISKQEGVSKRGGGELTPLRHEEVEFDHSGDSRAPATPFNNQQKITNAQVTDTRQQQGRFNNKSGDRLSKKKREVIKKRLQQSMGTDTAGIDTGQQTDAEQVIHTNRVKVPPADYGALNSEDDRDPDNQSLEESDEDAEDTMKHTGQVVGSSFQDKCTDVQRITEQQGLSPRGRK